MEITRTNTKGYIGTCSYPGCQSGESGLPYRTKRHGLRIKCVEEVRHHSRSQHGCDQREDRYMKQANATLPADEGLDKLGNYDGALIAVAKGWTYNAAFKTSFGLREAIEADVYVFDGKAWHNIAADSDGNVPSLTPIFWKTVIRQLQEAGNEDDFGGVLSTNIPGRKNAREWAILPAAGAQEKALEKFDAAKLPSHSF